MNWYKQQSTIQKESGFWGGVSGGMIIGLALWLGLSQAELYQLKQQHQGNEQAVVQTLKEEVQKQGGDPEVIIQQSKNDANITQDPQFNVTQDTGAPPPQPKEEEKGSDGNLADHYADHGMSNEGVRTRVYLDTAKIPTVGIGHAMGRTPDDKWAQRSIPIFQEVLKLNRDQWLAVHSGKMELTKKQVRDLYKYDVEEHIDRAAKSFKRWDNMPMFLKIGLLDSTFRGDTGPNTRGLINQGKYLGAASEYLNRMDYTRAKRGEANPKSGQVERGIIKRMETNAARILLMHMHQNNIPVSQAANIIKQKNLPETMLKYVNEIHEKEIKNETIGYVDIQDQPSGNYQFPTMNYQDGVMRAANKENRMEIFSVFHS